jgi:N-acetylglutamate synthase-like GNAT family acetyltransferase
MDNLTLRTATANDLEFAYRAKKAAFKGYAEQVRGWNEEEQRELHERRFSTQDFRIINLAGSDIGIMAMAVQPDCLKLNQLFVLPEHQGKGIGSNCISLILEEARQLGLPVGLRVLKVNSRARAFFHRLGFKRSGETGTHVLMECATASEHSLPAPLRPPH